MKEDQILISYLQDKIEQCGDSYMVTNSNFLDMRQKTLAESICKKYGGLRYYFYGGFEHAERTIAVFLPDYKEIPKDSNIVEFFHHDPEEDPLAILRISQAGYLELSHRDYLGSLTGLGIKREMIGDILVRKDGADIIVMKEMGNFLLYNYDKAGKVNLKVELLPVEQLIVPEGRFEIKKDTVASLRLDNVIASAFSLSRGKATAAITGGIVFVDGIQVDKADKIVKEGDKLVLRGKGKAILKTVGNVTRKDRIFIEIQKFI